MEPVRITSEGPIRLVGVDVNFIHCMSPDANNIEVLGDLWEVNFPRLLKLPGMQETRVYGMCRGSKSPCVGRHPDERNYVAGAAIDEGPDTIPDGMCVYEVPRATYAVFEHVGPVTQLDITVSSVYERWLPRSGYQHSGIADVEVFGDRFDGSETSVMEYWVSVRLPA